MTEPENPIEDSCILLIVGTWDVRKRCLRKICELICE